MSSGVRIVRKIKESVETNRWKSTNLSHYTHSIWYRVYATVQHPSTCLFVSAHTHFFEASFDWDCVYPGVILEILMGGSVAEWLACWTQVQKGPGSNRNRDAVG